VDAALICHITFAWNEAIAGAGLLGSVQSFNLPDVFFIHKYMYQVNNITLNFIEDSNLLT